MTLRTLRLGMIEWRDVVGYEGLYQASDTGLIRSVDRIDAAGKQRKGRVLRPAVTPANRLRVSLCKDGVMKSHLVHRLVAIAFIPNPGNKPEINHIKGVTTDNRVSQLEWCTAQENTDHAFASGLSRRASGDKHGLSKLAADDIVDIRWLRGMGVSVSELARQWGVSRRTIGSIFTGRTWGHV
jgi:hypothetical protein